MRTDYGAHEDVYRRRKERGDEVVRWAEPDEYIQALQPVLQKPYVPQSGRLLEMGCGGGELALWLVEQGYEVSGVDISSTAITCAQELAAKRGIQADFRVGNVLDLQNYTDELFDLVLDSLCLHCIIGADRKLFLASAHRVMKPGGFFFVKTMCGEPPQDRRHLYDPATRFLMFDSPGGRIVQRYHGLPETIVQEVGSAGFEILQWSVESDESGHDNLHIEALKPQAA